MVRRALFALLVGVVVLSIKYNALNAGFDLGVRSEKAQATLKGCYD